MRITESFEDPFYIETLPTLTDAKGRPVERAGHTQLSNGRVLKNSQVCYGGARKGIKSFPTPWNERAAKAAKESRYQLPGMTCSLYTPGETITQAEALRRMCAESIAGHRKTLRELACARWDMPDCCFGANRMERIWMLEAQICNDEDFLDLIDAVGGDESKKPALDQYYAAAQAKSRETDWQFPAAEYWPTEAVEAFRAELAEARWTLRALKMQHRLGLDPKQPRTLEGMTMARNAMQRMPTLDGGALKRGLQAILPKDWDKAQTAVSTAMPTKAGAHR